MQVAAPGTVLGDFGGVEFSEAGLSMRFHRRGDRFYVTALGPSGEVDEHEVLYTFGVAPLQQYLVALTGGRLQALTVAWDVEGGQWFSLYPDRGLVPDDPLFWGGRLQRWNDRCAECHSTDLRVGYDASTDRYRTTWAEVDVGCQACHGPGEAHLARATDGATGTAGAGYGLVHPPDGSRARAWVDTCARCHARRGRASAEDRHGRHFDDDFELSLLREGLYFADGQIQDEVYVTGSFMQSLMYRRGVSCIDCHDPHSGRVRAQGNDLCTACHGPSPPPSFPTLRAGDYDSAEHHRHADGSTGAACVGCHMPSRTYMRIDDRHDHSLRIPRPDLSVRVGTPNACTICHADRSDEWAAEVVAGWEDRGTRPVHYGEILARARAGEVGVAEDVEALVADTTQAAIVRATALELLGPMSPASAAQVAARVAADPEPLVRRAAAGALAAAPAALRLQAVGRLLVDSAGAVRAAAAQALAPLASELDPATRWALERVVIAREAALEAQASQPEALHNLGNLYAALGRLPVAESSYRRAIELDQAFAPAHVNLAMLLNQNGRNDEAEGHLRAALSGRPEDGELHYSLGLLLAETGRVDEAAQHLVMAAERLPDRPRVHYNLGLALQQSGDTLRAEQALLHAADLAPESVDVGVALVFHYRSRGRLDEAVLRAGRLVELRPEDAPLRGLLDELLAERERR